MPVEHRWEQGWDLLRDNLDRDRAETVKFLVDKMLSTSTDVLAMAGDIAASTTLTVPLASFSSSQYDNLFIFVTQEATIELISGQAVTLPALGFILLAAKDVAFLEINMLTTAGSYCAVLGG